MVRLSGGLSALAAIALVATSGVASAQENGAHMCGGIAGLQCPSGSVCVMTGPSHPDQSGLCRTPDRAGRVMCPAIYQPVCGQDGKTYSNRCVADRAEVPLAHPGRCGVMPAPPTGQPYGERG